MKKFLLIFTLLFSVFVSGQTVLKGRVVSTNNMPLVGASVYLNNTSIGTISDDKGKFEFSIPEEGVYELIISHLGYLTIKHKINTAEITKPFLFRTAAKVNELEEVVVEANKKQSKRDKRRKLDHRKYHFSRFKRAFLGRTNFAKNCKIENPKVLSYYLDKETKELSVEASQPLVIFNKDLGYRVYYDLVHFKLNGDQVSYSGYTRYEKLKGSKRKNRRWKTNRLKAYNGSLMHFLRTLIDTSTVKEGYKIRQFERKINPNYPTKEELAYSRKVLKEYFKKGVSYNYGKKIEVPKTRLDTALIISRRSRYKKFTDSIFNKELDYKDISFKEGGKTYLKSDYPIQITYTKEKEEDNYRPGKARLNEQTSNLFLYKSPIEILVFGQFTNPLVTLSEKYWGYEQFAETLPLDYKPPKD